VQPAAHLVAGEEVAFVEQFPHGGRVGGSDPLAGANFFFAVVRGAR
jgi:hypothetical protein